MRNWRRVREATVVFPEVGTVAMLGVNGEAMKSAGAGKTSLGEAVSRTVFGVPPKALGRMSFHGKGNTYVRVDGTLDGKPLVVEAGYKCKELGGTGEGLRFTIDGIATQRADVKDTRAELNSVLGISTQLAEWTVFMNGDKLDFSELSQAMQVELLMQALQQPPWPSYLQQARKGLEWANGHEMQARADLDSARGSLVSAENAALLAHEAIANQQRRLQEVTNIYNSLHLTHETELKRLDAVYKKAEAEQKAAQKEVAEVMTTADKQVAAEFKAEVETAQKVYAAAQVEARKAATKLALDRAEHQRLLRELQRFTERPETCPTCGQKWPADEHLEVEKRRVRDSLSKALEAKARSAEISAMAEKREHDADDEVYAIRKRMEERKEQLTKAVVDRAALAEKKAEAAALAADEWESKAPEKPDDTALAHARAVHEAKGEMVTACACKVRDAGQALGLAEREVMIRKYWVEALGPTGIPNLIINQALPPLNVAAQAASVALTGGEIAVSFGTTRELATGEERNKLTVYVDNPRGADELGEFSKGEGGFTNLIISESLSMIGQLPRRCAWRWLDEAINNQDRKHVYGYYKRLAHTNRIVIFLVDHHPDALALADHVLIATKDEAGFTSYAWS